MPDFNVRTWPNTGEEPSGLMVPEIGPRVGLWSPVMRAITTITTLQGGVLDWGGRSFATGEVQDDGKLRYITDPTPDGCIYWLDLWFVPQTPPFDPAFRADVTVNPPPLSTAPEPLHYDWRNTSLELTNGPSREVTYGWRGDIREARPCSQILPIGVFELRAVDPLEFDITPLARYASGCDP